MLRALVAALILLVGTSALAGNLVQVRCFPADQILSAADAIAHDEGTEVLDIAGPAAQRYLDYLNEQPPGTAMKAARIILVPRKEGGPSLSIFLSGSPFGCIVGRIKPEYHRKALEASKETPA